MAGIYKYKNKNEVQVVLFKLLSVAKLYLVQNKSMGDDIQVRVGLVDCI